MKTDLINKKRVLILCDWYEPGFKAGGPIQSSKNIVASLSHLYEFFILTSDRDLGDHGPYQNIRINEWTDVNCARIWYASPEFMQVSNIRNIIHEIQPEIVYANSMFSRSFTLLPLLALRRMKFGGRVIIAPRGMLHSGAMKRKKLKKNLFLGLFSLTGWPGKMVFHATDKQEISDIRKFFSKAGEVILAGNIPNSDPNGWQRIEKNERDLKCVFISRVHPKKNIHYFLERMKGVDREISLSLDMYGEIDDKKYESFCRELISELPDNIQVNIHPPVMHAKVFETIRKYHLFVLPTLGENFGHAIFEALSASRPVLISDHTPWKELEIWNAGWVVPLENKNSFVEILHVVARMNQLEFDKWAKGAKQYADTYIKNSDFEAMYKGLFQ